QGGLAGPARGREGRQSRRALLRGAGHAPRRMTMLAVTFRFYGNLNDFLPGNRRNALIEQRMADHAAVKHPIEALGIPHTEIGAILVNRQAVDFTYRLNDGDRVEAYPPEVVHLLPTHVPLRP